jgi:hypothetical protein
MRPIHLHSLLITLLLSVMFMGAWMPTDEQIGFVLQPGSQVWIEGTSSVNQFTCRATDLAGNGYLSGSGIPMYASSTVKRPQIDFRVPVAEFDCGKKRMNKDLYKALKSNHFPEIQYTLESVDFVAEEQGYYRMQVTGRMTIAGTERALSMDVSSRRLPNGHYRASGTHALLMTDFDIEPPTALLGLIKTRNRIVIGFDFVASPDTMQATY